MLRHNTSIKTIPERVVVMGAGGFVGASLIKNLQDNQIAFLSLRKKNINLLEDDASYRLAELLNPDDTLIVVSAVAPCKNNEMLLQNISMMKSVCEAIEVQQPKHVIYVSSDAVYADSPCPLTEISCAEPGSIHGVMHLSREIMLKQVCRAPIAILRPTLIYGAEDTHNGYGPNQFLRLALANKEISLFGEGEEKRDHVFIRDVVNILLLVILHRSQGVLNVATGSAVSFRRVAEIVSEYFMPKAEITTKPRMGPMPHNGYRPFDPSTCKAAFPEFSYTNLAEGVELSFKTLKSNE